MRKYCNGSFRVSYHALKAQAQTEGSVNIGNLSVQNFGSHNFGYMYQHNLFCGVLTVKEHLYFMVSRTIFFVERHYAHERERERHVFAGEIKTR